MIRSFGMGGKLEFVETGVKKAASFSISFRWYMKWPMMLKSTFTKQMLEEKRLAWEGINDDYFGKKLELSKEEIVRVKRKPTSSDD